MTGEQPFWRNSVTDARVDGELSWFTSIREAADGKCSGRKGATRRDEPFSGARRRRLTERNQPAWRVMFDNKPAEPFQGELSPSRARTMASTGLLSPPSSRASTRWPTAMSPRWSATPARPERRSDQFRTALPDRRISTARQPVGETSAYWRHKCTASRVNRPVCSFLTSSARASPSALQTVRFIALAALATRTIVACWEPSGPWPAVVEIRSS